MTGGLLSRRALILTKIEGTYNEDAVPTAALDALLVSDPVYTIDPNVLERDFVRDDLSPLGHTVGRKLAGFSFGVELRSNGLTDSGSLGDAAKLGTLMRACGFSETAITGAGCVGAAQAADTNAGPVVTFGTEAGPSTYQTPSDLALTVILGGASATATVRVSGGDGVEGASFLRSETFEAFTDSVAGTITVDAADPLDIDYVLGGTFVVGDVIHWNVGGFRGSIVAADTSPTDVGDDLETAISAAHTDITGSNSTGTVSVTFANDMAGEVITTAVTPIDLLGSGGTVIMTWSGSLVLGDRYDVPLIPVGIEYQPVSTGFESATIYAYFDGNLHQLTGCYGTFTMSAEAGTFGSVQFSFTGQYIDPLESPIPSSAVYESALPQQIENSRLQIGNFSAIVNAFSYDQANTIVPRPDVNSPDGYLGTRITGRNPAGGIDPEAELAGTEDFWVKFAAATQMKYQMRFGAVAGNRIWVTAPSVQYTNMTYGDREGIRIYDAGLKFGRKYGNDEIKFHFG